MNNKYNKASVKQAIFLYKKIQSLSKTVRRITENVNVKRKSIMKITTRAKALENDITEAVLPDNIKSALRYRLYFILKMLLNTIAESSNKDQTALNDLFVLYNGIFEQIELDRFDNYEFWGSIKQRISRRKIVLLAMAMTLLILFASVGTAELIDEIKGNAQPGIEAEEEAVIERVHIFSVDGISVLEDQSAKINLQDYIKPFLVCKCTNDEGNQLLMLISIKDYRKHFDSKFSAEKIPDDYLLVFNDMIVYGEQIRFIGSAGFPKTVLAFHGIN